MIVKSGTGRLTSLDLDLHNAERGRMPTSSGGFLTETEPAHRGRTFEASPPARPQRTRIRDVALAVAIGLGLCAALLFGLKAL